MNLPKAKHEHGYTQAEVQKICEAHGVLYGDFHLAFGIGHTMALSDTGESLTNGKDIEDTLESLRKAKYVAN